MYIGELDMNHHTGIVAFPLHASKSSASLSLDYLRQCNQPAIHIRNDIYIYKLYNIY